MSTISRRDLLKSAGSLAVAYSLGSLGGSASFGQATAPAQAAKGGTLAQTWQGGKAVLPKLPYDLKALEPIYDARTLQLHYEKHHGGSVKGANDALEKLQAARQAGDYSAVQALSRDLAYYASGHVLHSLFWPSMTPGGSVPPAALARLGRPGVRTCRRAADDPSDRETPGPDGVGRPSAAGVRRVGARVLPSVPEPPAGMGGCFPKTGQLVLRRQAPGRGDGVIRGGTVTRVLFASVAVE